MAESYRMSMQAGDGPPVEFTDADLRRANRILAGKAARERAGKRRIMDVEEMAGVHPDQAAREDDPDVGGIATDRLRSIVERVERLEQEKKALSEDIKDIFTEAKSAGFEPKVLKRIIAERRREPADVEEEETLLDLYRRALGM